MSYLLERVGLQSYKLWVSMLGVQSSEHVELTLLIRDYTPETIETDMVVVPTLNNVSNQEQVGGLESSKGFWRKRAVEPCAQP